MARDRKPRSDVPTFESREERDRWQVAKYGHVRNGFREEGEESDGRPLLVYPEPFWESPTEESFWLRAVRSCPLSQYGHLDAFAYLAEVAKVATGLSGGVKSMPRMSRRRWDQRLMTLREQENKNPEGGQ
jgi:hypothetical protein